jgi:CRP-like cAMP-binding protein
MLGIQDSSGVIINSALSHQGIGDRLLMTRETATRVLLRMREQNEIEITAGRRIKLLPAFYEKTAECELYKALTGMQNSH